MLKRLGSIGCAEIPIDTRFGEVVVLHQRVDEHALGASVPEFGVLLPRQFFGPAELHASFRQGMPALTSRCTVARRFSLLRPAKRQLPVQENLSERSVLFRELPDFYLTTQTKATIFSG